MRKTGLALCLLTVAMPLSAPRAADPVPYPEGYRDWHHVKSMVIQPGHPLYDAFGGIHHLYANEAAVRGYRTGTFPDGAVIVFDLLAAEATEDHAVVEGERKVVGVMHKGAERWSATGGWGFQAFAGDGGEPVLDAAGQEACFACHTARADSGYVFSTLRR